MTTKSTRAMHMAHIYKKNAPMICWADCMRYAWMLIRFRQKLQNGIVTFSFIKRDGSHRIATGTLHYVLIPLDKKPMANGQQPKAVNHGVITYFDLEKQDWRSFRIEDFTGTYDVFQLTRTEHKEID